MITLYIVGGEGRGRKRVPGERNRIPESGNFAPGEAREGLIPSEGALWGKVGENRAKWSGNTFATLYER